MADNPQSFSRGDWVVHLHHGVGKIKGIVKRRVGGKQSAYYRLEAGNQTLFVPVDDVDPDRVRPVSSGAEFKQALEILESTPREMDEDPKEREQYINTVWEDGSIMAISRLVRDLVARQKAKKLSTTGKRALQHFEALLVGEWAARKKIPVDEARKELETVLKRHEPEPEP